eukprot:4047399-Heterocapsa_arctica.AAC.1
MMKVKHEAGPIKGSTKPTKPSASSWGPHKIKDRLTTYLMEKIDARGTQSEKLQRGVHSRE